MNKKLLFFVALFVVVLCCAAFCLLPQKQPEQNDSRPRVTALIFPYYDIARAVGGDKIRLTMLLKPGAEVHSFDPSPQELINLRKSDLFIYTGGENDSWVKKLLPEKAPDGPRQLRLIDKVPLLHEETIEGMTAPEHHHEEEQEGAHEEEQEAHGGAEPENDEHIWTSPANAALLTEAVCDALSAIDPTNASYYKNNAAAHIAKLRELNRELRETASQGRRRTIVVGDRFPFRYLAKECGLSYFAAFPGCAAESEPDAATVAFLIKKVRAEKIPVVFYLELSNGKTAATVCAETGAKKLLLHSCHNITLEDFKAGVTYIELMRANLKNLKEALN